MYSSPLTCSFHPMLSQRKSRRNLLSPLLKAFMNTLLAHLTVRIVKSCWHSYLLKLVRLYACVHSCLAFMYGGFQFSVNVKHNLPILIWLCLLYWCSVKAWGLKIAIGRGRAQGRQLRFHIPMQTKAWKSCLLPSFRDYLLQHRAFCATFRWWLLIFFVALARLLIRLFITKFSIFNGCYSSFLIYTIYGSWYVFWATKV